MKRLAQFKPDLILTVHPMFNGSIINLLEYYKVDIPLIALQADIINIHKTWCDPRAYLTLCPTEEAYSASIAMDMPPERLVKCGFPTRAQFIRAAQSGERREYDGVRPLQCLMMSGGEGSGNMQKYAVELSGQAGVREAHGAPSPSVGRVCCPPDPTGSALNASRRGTSAPAT